MEGSLVNLFIFNSNNRLVKTLVLFLATFILYSIALHRLNPKVEVFQNQWIKNHSIAEAFIYKVPAYRTVIVGSSMAAKLVQKDLDGDDIYNLSFEGGSSLTGLRIIKESNIIPKEIYIETNIIERKLNENMLSSLFTPVIWRIKKHLISLQYTYQPINIALTFINAKFGKDASEKVHVAPNQGKLKFGINRHRASENGVNTFNEQRIVEQKKVIDYFTSKGVNIVFFQMPVHEEILSTKGYQERKKVLEKLFSKFEFHWVENDHHYETTDGIHLNLESANEYALVLKSINNRSLE